MVDQWALSIRTVLTVNIVLEITRIVRSGASTRRDSIVFGKGEILPEDPVLTFYATYTPGSAPFFFMCCCCGQQSIKAGIYYLRQNDFYSFGYLVLDLTNIDTDFLMVFRISRS